MTDTATRHSDDQNGNRRAFPPGATQACGQLQDGDVTTLRIQLTQYAKSLRRPRRHHARTSQSAVTGPIGTTAPARCHVVVGDRGSITC